jgi:hypothetical protein
MAGGAGPAPAGDAQAVINALQLLKVLTPCLHPQLLLQALQLLPVMVGCCRHANAGVRLAAARCAAALALALPDRVLPALLKLLLPLLDGSCPAAARGGGVEMVAQLVQALGVSERGVLSVRSAAPTAAPLPHPAPSDIAPLP